MASFISHSKPTITESDINAVNAQLQSKLLAKGNKVIEFGELVALTNNVEYAICTSSGSAALQVILSALELPKKSEIILPSYVCKSVYNSILAMGYLPVLCDIGSDWVMTYSSVKEKISKQTAAIILVHTFGIDAWNESFFEFKIPIIEDFCQGYALQKYNKRHLMGIAGFCSFNATKFLTTGEGGAVISNDVVLRDRITKNLVNNITPFIFSDFQASLGISQLNQLGYFISKRKEIANNYFNGIKNSSLIHKFQQVEERSLCFRFLIFGDFEIDRIIQNAEKEGIALRRGVDALLHENVRNNKSNFVNAESIFKSTLSLPIFPSLTIEEQDRVINFVNSI